jgi:hypothetical protein
VTTELNYGVTAGQRVNRGSGSTDNAQARHPRLPEAKTVRTNDRPGAGRSESARAAQAQLTVDVPNRRYVGDTTFRWYDTVLARLFSATTILPVRGGPRGGVTVAQGTRLSALAAFFVGDLSKGVRLFARNLSGKVHDGDRFSGRYHDGAG